MPALAPGTVDCDARNPASAEYCSSMGKPRDKLGERMSKISSFRAVSLSWRLNKSSIQSMGPPEGRSCCSSRHGAFAGCALVILPRGRRSEPAKRGLGVSESNLELLTFTAIELLPNYRMGDPLGNVRLLANVSKACTNVASSEYNGFCFNGPVSVVSSKQSQTDR